MVTERPYPQEVEFQASLALETNRVPDPFVYQVKEGNLFSPVTQDWVENSITQNDSIEEAEYEAFQKIQNWATKSEDGIAVWISPPHPYKYDAAKIIFSEILYNFSLEKFLRNRAICFDWTPRQCLSFAKNLGLSAFTSEELRSSPVFLEISVEEFLKVIESYSPKQAGIIRNGKDFLIKEEIMAGLMRGIPAPLGPYSPSCSSMAKSAFSTMFEGSLNLGESFFECPRCHGPIPSGRGLTTCPHCGARKGDFNSGCD